ncbi:MAG: ATP-binding protein, partial [Mariprofundaceae bacterium]|nr:ATP-binding protein [Mariprofundaceae bacterium]
MIFILWMKGEHEERIEYEALQAVNAAQVLYEANMQSRQDRLITSLKIILSNHELAMSFAQGDRQRLLEQSKPLFLFLKEDGITHFYFHTVDQHVLLRVHQPNHHGDQISRQTLLQSVKDKTITTALELGALGTLTLRSVAPWYHKGILIGYLELGIEVNQLLLGLHALQNVEVAIFLFKRHLDRRSWLAGQKILGRSGDWSLLHHKVIAGSSLAHFSPALLRLVNDRLGQKVHGFAFDKKQSFYSKSFNIHDVNHQQVAEMLLLYDITEVYTGSMQELYISGSTLTLLSGLLLMALWFMLGHLERKLRHEVDARTLLEDQHIESVSKQNKHLKDSEEKLRTHVEQMHLAQLASLNMMQDIEHGRKVSEDALKTKSRFLAMMSHEIRTPLNGILGLSELLLDGRLNQIQRAHLQAIFSSGHTLLTILNDILDYSKMEVGQLKLNQVPIQVNDTIEHVSKLFAASMHRKGLQFSCSGIPLLNHFLLGDSDRIQQILMNLVSNALKFTSKGEVAMRCLLEEETDTTIQIRFEVMDTGIGIDVSQQEKLFEEFFQVDASHSRQHGGTGLGLAISNNLVHMMGG